MRLERLTKTALIIAVVGALNWGLIGFFNWNLVDAIFGGGSREITSGVSRFVYALVGIAGIYGLVRLLSSHERVHRADRRVDVPA